jgi:hypothetical protein
MRARRITLIAAAAFSLALTLAFSAEAKAVLKTAVKKLCTNTSLAVPDGPEAGDFVSGIVSTGKVCPKKLECGYGGLPLGAVVVDVNAKLRVTHPSVGDLNVLMVDPTGLLSTVTSRSGPVGADFGRGATSCKAAFTTFDDSAPSAITGATQAPFAGAFRPVQPLRGHNGTYGAGDWRFYFDDVVAGGQGRVEAIGLRLTYRYKPLKRRPK